METDEGRVTLHTDPPEPGMGDNWGLFWHMITMTLDSARLSLFVDAKELELKGEADEQCRLITSNVGAWAILFASVQMAVLRVQSMTFFSNRSLALLFLLRKGISAIFQHGVLLFLLMQSGIGIQHDLDPIRVAPEGYLDSWNPSPEILLW